MGEMRTPTFFRPRRLGHVNLWVTSLERSERFYNEVCGLTIEFTEPGLIASFLGTGHTPHDLGMIEKTDGKARYGRDGLLQLPAGIGLSAGLNHLAWELDSEAALVSGFKALKANGIAFDMTVDHQVAHSVYMSDPDGNSVEYYCDTVRDWRKVLHGPMDLITAAWDPLTAEGFTEGRYDEDPKIRVVANAPVHPKRLTHAVLVTDNVPRLTEFYCTVGGLHVVGASAMGEIVLLASSHAGYPICLALCKGETPAFHHSAFEIESESALDAAAEELSRRGVEVVATTDLRWKRSLFLQDPDGILTEYYVARGESRNLDELHGRALPPAHLI